ncbi:ankyrin [Auricularia subglabra TFB-10046 SS5]|nr:ankyrin [Auricularia subglabra TFB-10046 SS5]
MSQAEFDAAAHYLSSSTALSKVSNAVKLELYALFKAATVRAQPTTKRPSIFDMTGRAKWDAWAALPTGSADEYRARYVAKARELGWDGALGTDKDTNSATSKESDDDPIDWDTDDHPRKAGDAGGMGLSVSTMSPNGDSAAADNNTLHSCIQAGDIEQVKALLASPGVQVNATDEFGFTPLHLAADRGHEPIVALLLERGADANIRDPDGETALSLAEVSDHTGIIRLLQERTATRS